MKNLKKSETKITVEKYLKKFKWSNNNFEETIFWL